jgi:FtsZ-interacting cell division protein ZipA
VPTWLIIVIVVIVVLAVGGFFARRAQLARNRPAFERSLEKVNHDLARAAAEDRGWDRERLETAARRLFAEHSGGDAEELVLVEVRDRPGTDEDQAVFRAQRSGAAHRLTLGRSGGEWVHESLEAER